ncbi:MAG: hypothetical protein AB1546_13990 [bacterium]
MKPLRVYADTSVISGCLDAEFEDDSMQFIEAVRSGKIVMLVSEVVARELENAPEEVCIIITSLPAGCVERVELTEEILELRDAYLEAGIVGVRHANDAAHVAAATVARADAIVSWNFRHIVRLDKMKLYNRINLLYGYGILTIITPKEVQTDDREEK